MTFGLVYAFSERFILPLSHDEVVHGKGSLYGRVPGDHETKLAALRTYLSFMWTHPGKKLLFMGGEFGQPAEWNHDGELAWSLLESKGHAGLQRLVIDLNALYRRAPALHRTDADPAGFQWLVGDDSTNSVFAYLRRDERNAPILCVVNMTPVARNDYRIGVPSRGRWSEILNTDSEQYGGGNRGNLGGCHAEASSLHQQPYAVTLQLPPLSTLIFSSGE
jgi:1,4-alpha-glucan branching enzyme